MAASQQHATSTYIWFLHDILGTGATGCVYKARHKKTGEFYAVKVFNQMSYMRPRSVQMREFDVLRRLNHDNVVRLLAVEEEMTMCCNVLIMELCTGGSLYNLLDEPENAYGLEENEFFCVIHDIAAGLEHLWKQDIVHRDIKPGNIMRYIADDGRSIYKLTDFGAARELQDEESYMSLYGTEEYLFPDVYERAVLRRPMGKKFGAEVDLWSLGVTLYHVATGQLPFRPFGGRKNREVMYKITTEKDSGVISGFQSEESGPIEWSRELPDTCQLSQGAKLLVTALLAGLMECNVEIMWTFEKFFEETTDICTRVRVYVFSMCTATILHLFLHKDDCYPKIQEKIAEQTDIHASNQILLFDNTRLHSIVQPMQHVDSYPRTSDARPFMLLYNSVADVPRFVPTSYPKVAPLVKRNTVDTDAQLGRSCAASICAMLRVTRDSILKQSHIHTAVKMIQAVQIGDIRQIQGFTNQFCILVTETKKRLSVFTAFLSTMLMFANVCGNDMHTAVKSLHKKLNDLYEAFVEIENQAQEANHYINDYTEKIVHKRELKARWKSTLGCQESDRCVAKMEIIREGIKEIRNTFSEHKKLKTLSSTEEKIHYFDKIRLCKLYDNGRRQLDRHCLKNEQDIFYKAIRQYDLIDGMVGNKVRRVESQIMAATEKLNSLHPQLDMIHKELEEQLKEISSDVLGKLSPNARKEIKTRAKPEENEISSPPVTNLPNYDILMKFQDEVSGLQEMMEINRSLLQQLDKDALCI